MEWTEWRVKKGGEKLEKNGKDILLKMASILDLSTDPMGPIECIFSKITDVPTIIALESACKSFRQAALAYCWNTEELSLEIRDGKEDVRHVGYYVNGARFSHSEGMLTGIDLIIARSKSSIPKLRLTDTGFRMLLRHLMSKENQFQEIILNKVVLTKNSPELTAFLVRQREIKKFIIMSSDIHDLSRGSEDSPNYLCRAFAQMPQLSEFGCIDTWVYNAGTHTLEKFLRGRSLQKLTLDTWHFGIYTTPIEKSSILSSLKSLDKLVATSLYYGLDEWNQIFEFDSVKQVLSGIKELEIKFPYRFWTTSPDHYGLFEKFLPIIPASCPLLKSFVIKVVNWNMQEADRDILTQHHVMGLSKMAALFLHQNANMGEVKTLVLRWKESQTMPDTFDGFSALQNQLSTVPGVLESEILGNGEKKVKIQNGSAVLEMIFDGW